MRHFIVLIIFLILLYAIRPALPLLSQKKKLRLGAKTWLLKSLLIEAGVTPPTKAVSLIPVLMRVNDVSNPSTELIL